MEYEMLGTKILVKRFKKNEKTLSGFVLPDSMQKMPARGEVLAVGPGKTLSDGSVKPLRVQPGCTVCFSEYSGQLLESDDRTKESDLVVLENEDEILAVVRK